MDRRAFLAGTAALLSMNFSPVAAAGRSAANTLLQQTKLGRRLVDRLSVPGRTDENIIVSPASVTSLLSILDILADARMRSAIGNTLGFDGVDNMAELARLRTLVLENAAVSEKFTKFSLSNAMVLNQALHDNLDGLRGAGVELVTERGPAAVRYLNEWVSRKTEGAIDRVLDTPPSPTDLIAINAMYFRSFWRERFDPANTRPQTFQQASGSIQVPMMSQSGTQNMRSDGRFVAVDLSYKSGRFALALVTTTDKPAKAAEFGEVNDWLRGEAYRPESMQLSLPKFTLSEGVELLPALDAMGLKAGRSSRPDDVSAFTNFVQRIYLQVDEEGTKAAAASAVFTSRMINRPKTIVAFDKPFIFGLRDQQTGLMLLTGYVGRLNGVRQAVAQDESQPDIPS